MNAKERLLYASNWNIGFCDCTSEILLGKKRLGKVTWMKHPYKDRWFADPFILKTTEHEIIVFVEECPIENPKGILCELVIDIGTKRLKKRYVLLEMDTHLSYPAIISYDGKVYVCPENSASGNLKIYEYDSEHHKLINPLCILNDALADATIIEFHGSFYMIATKAPETQEKSYLYKSDSLFGPFAQIGELPVQYDRSCSRPGGNWFYSSNQLYRPAQNCVERYGSALSIMQVDSLYDSMKECKAFSLEPIGNRYNLGLHTLNIKDSICVIDGYGYLYSYFARMYTWMSRVKNKWLRNQ